MAAAPLYLRAYKPRELLMILLKKLYEDALYGRPIVNEMPVQLAQSKFQKHMFFIHECY